MSPVIVSVSDFRANMMVLYHQYISPKSSTSRPVEVRDMKRDKKLFVIQPEKSKDNELEKKRLVKYIKKLEADRGKLKLDYKAIANVRRNFNENIKERLLNAQSHSN
ncbi:hypothetical protein KKE34_02805 [Patescibacteria group bacterium]|nr:hypothetical protein [Patescibacteria group bacterium]MBU1885519.1 hypothetical protein [Patescibacteria group bacterium]